MVWDISDVWKRRMGIIAKKLKALQNQRLQKIETVTEIKMGTFVKKNKLNNSSKWFTFWQKIRS